MRSVSGSLRALMKVFNNFASILLDPITLLFLSNFISCFSSLVTGFMDKVVLIGLFKFLDSLEKYVFLEDFCFYCFSNITNVLV